ncbi:ATP phosphoribosyltransferase regulatory subunit [Thermanaerosceptrum fracticalcis]|uniref:ATP phosphoribosyltransferase regulatory subunit n=1 Tax=Thermanaerosceptrum fracticalcis TaxID=1712410 RepID=A0A7G6E6H3_THEFR|nr:ATP phosphoribosyltransferase regulatory subunit [Thermanaerosceptrum fracticalcis]QNB47677.1 ATP phosphoribosyltransferase regulatory subunit [Thermanaerosceptrum fracticalcis]
MYQKRTWNIPVGMRDWLPGEAARRRDLTNELLQTMATWGYTEIATPLLEYYQTLVQGEEGAVQDQLYKLIDRDGSILALRPELTTPIARVVSSKIEGAPPWRLMYGAEVFRYEDVQTGRQREFSQVGAELIGQEGPEADCEILALAIEALKTQGLERFTVSIGHMGVLQGLLQSLTCEENQLKAVRHLVLEKDFVGLNELLEKAGLAQEKREAVVDLLTRPLDIDNFPMTGSGLPGEILTALADLKGIVNLIALYGYEPYIQVDLSTLRNQEYYTGMVFEVYTAGLGYPIGGGGRYDHLLHRFGHSYPATGFALGVDRLLLSLAQKEKKSELFLVAGEEPGLVLKKAQTLRAEGKKVIAELRRITEQEAKLLSREKEAQLVWLGGVTYYGD